MKPIKFVLMSYSPVFIKKFLEAGLIPEVVVSFNPYYFKPLANRHKIIQKTFGACKCFITRLLRLPGYEVFWLCKKEGIRVWPDRLVNHENFAALLKELNVDFGFVYNFRLLKENIFSAPRYGTINMHPSLLPKNRGATPGEWVIYTGEAETGISLHYINNKIDSGQIIEQHKIPISPMETKTTLQHTFDNLGTDLFIRFVYKLIYHGLPAAIELDEDIKGSYDKVFTNSMFEIKTYSLNKKLTI